MCCRQGRSVRSIELFIDVIIVIIIAIDKLIL